LPRLAQGSPAPWVDHADVIATLAADAGENGRAEGIWRSNETLMRQPLGRLHLAKLLYFLDQSWKYGFSATVTLIQTK
jgi:hypothetical protein